MWIEGSPNEQAYPGRGGSPLTLDPNPVELGYANEGMIVNYSQPVIWEIPLANGRRQKETFHGVR